MATLMKKFFFPTLALIDETHAQDPSKIITEGKEAVRARFRLAIRSQHLRRWEASRDSYPTTKAAYYSWRTFLKKDWRQAEQASQMDQDVRQRTRTSAEDSNGSKVSGFDSKGTLRLILDRMFISFKPRKNPALNRFIRMISSTLHRKKIHVGRQHHI